MLEDAGFFEIEVEPVADQRVTTRIVLDWLGETRDRSHIFGEDLGAAVRR